MRSLLSLVVALVVGIAGLQMAGAAENGPQPVYVERLPGDCVNTFTLRLLVTASNYGRAYGDFDGSRFYMARQVYQDGGGEQCRVKSVQVANDGQTVEDQQIYQCLFSDPLTGQ